jgi:hypothetical protein
MVSNEPQGSAMTSATQIFVPQTFSSTISTKLTQDNFLTWMQHAESTIKGYRLKKHIEGKDAIFPQFLTTADEQKHVVNPNFENFEQQDTLLKSWLLESMDSQFKI